MATPSQGPESVRRRARRIDAARFDAWRARIGEATSRAGVVTSTADVDAAAALATSFESVGLGFEAHPEDIAALEPEALWTDDLPDYREEIAGALDGSRAELRRFVRRGRLKAAAWEWFARPSFGIDRSSRFISTLARAAIEHATRFALAEYEARYGEPWLAEGRRCGFVVFGMGKLGGDELNPISDIDLVYLYESDEGAMRGDPPRSITLHEFFAKVARRITMLLEDVTGDGCAWPVDLRLRPNGSQSSVVISFAAFERYFESTAQPWERAVWLRASPAAGDLALGREALAAIAPFIYPRAVQPHVLDDMQSMLTRARRELDGDTSNVKLALGGIREAEFFVQGLCLVWGGRHKELRVRPTFEALRALEQRGFATAREVRRIGDGYALLRRVEHAIQYDLGRSEQRWPDEPVRAMRLARTLGFSDAADARRRIDEARTRVAKCFAALRPWAQTASPTQAAEIVDALLDGSDDLAAELWEKMIGRVAPGDAVKILERLAKRGGPFGARDRRDRPERVEAIVRAVADTPDPERALGFLGDLSLRQGFMEGYLATLADDRPALQTFVGLLGASAYLGQSLVAHPMLLDRFLSSDDDRRPDAAEAVVDDELRAAQLRGEPVDDLEVFIGALRRSALRVTFAVARADLAERMDKRAVGLALSAIAEAIVRRTTERVLDTLAGARDGKIAVIAVGKFGGHELGYGSDLDLFFLHEGLDPAVAARAAQRIVRLLGSPHGDGPGYELDTRLRPSGSQGMLVVSLDAFCKYHGLVEGAGATAQDWERQALIKARAVAGDRGLGARIERVCERLAFEEPAPSGARVHELRMRMEHELTRERHAPGERRFDIKLGRGGLVDVEFAVQWLQMVHGADARLRVRSTDEALDALENAGILGPEALGTLREGWHLLREVERRSRLVHGRGASLVEEGAPGLNSLARSLGFRGDDARGPGGVLMERLEEVTLAVRAAYAGVFEVDLAEGPHARA
jgi:glutamate-ammonia-ligase adenylyltransferase